MARMDQVVQIAGALAILVAFALAQFGLLHQYSYSFLVLNLVGSAVLAVLAYAERQWASYSSRRCGQSSPPGA